jgi:hypothetical protein
MEVLPFVYEICQLKDVMGSLKAGFDFELDCEYYDYGSFPLKKQTQSSEIYFKLQMANRSLNKKLPANAILLDQELTADLLEVLESLPSTEDLFDENKAFDEGSTPLMFVVRMTGNVYVHSKRYFLKDFKKSGLRYKVCHYTGARTS